jgi:hypothetical protein
MRKPFGMLVEEVQALREAEKDLSMGVLAERLGVTVERLCDAKDAVKMLQDIPQAAVIAAARGICGAEHGQGAWADCKAAFSHQEAAIAAFAAAAPHLHSSALCLHSAERERERIMALARDCDAIGSRAGGPAEPFADLIRQET